MIRQEIAIERHAAALARVPELLKPVLELHKPVPDWGYQPDRNSYSGCDGCDPGTYAEERPDWPCTTWKLVAGETD